jgi:hypothetical protein
LNIKQLKNHKNGLKKKIEETLIEKEEFEE